MQRGSPLNQPGPVTPEIAEQLRDVKAKYLTGVDLKAWDQVRAAFTDDCRFEGLWAAAATPMEFVANLRSNLTEDVVTVHQGFLPRFRATSGGAVRGVWAMTDYLAWPPGSRGYLGVSLPGQCGVRGFGFYEDEYRLDEDGWRISFMRLTRLRIDPILEPAPALDYPFARPDPSWLA